MSTNSNTRPQHDASSTSSCDRVAHVSRRLESWANVLTPLAVQVVTADVADHTVMDGAGNYECQPTFTRFI
ncbi:hypothetical protein E2C01_029544 [Portunus trituberculatus]|uniref:Uncharacterized protein n=1 Tax=Portunus trituberculatus TaxID=210409 RepID=A0A5B7ES65_PORTR|nr:hypothetical protein [Portunus trituberculatus]